MIRQRHFIAVVGAFLIAGVVVGCASAQGNIDDERGGEEGADATNEEATAPKGDRSVAGTAQEELVGFDEEVVSPPSQANEPRDFGEGSLWATGYDPDPSTIGGVPYKALLKRVDPQTGKVVEAISLGRCVSAGSGPQVAVGAGSVWVSFGIDYREPMPGPPPQDPKPQAHSCDVVFRVDPRTMRVVDQIPVALPTELAFGFGSVWVTSMNSGTLSRIDPKTGEVVAQIDVDRGADDIAVDESSGAVWVAGRNFSSADDKPENEKLSRVDPETNRVVARIPIPADAVSDGADGVAVGEGAVWVSSGGKLVKVDPETNEVAGMVSVGGSYSQLVVNGGGVWAMSGGPLVRVDPTTMHVVAAEDIGPNTYTEDPGLAAGGGYVWFLSGEALARVSATSWQGQTTEEARCEGSGTIMMKGNFITTNDIPGCPYGGLFSGTDNSDALYGLKGEDEIHGLGGSDDIYGGGGNDIIYAGPGDDTWLTGDDGDDVIYGGAGNDYDMYGEGGDDVLYGGAGDDGSNQRFMSGGGGEDVLYGGDGIDTLDGTGDGGQRDKLYCGEGRDYYLADKNDYVDSSCEIKGEPLIF